MKVKKLFKKVVRELPDGRSMAGSPGDTFIFGKINFGLPKPTSPVFQERRGQVPRLLVHLFSITTIEAAGMATLEQMKTLL
jgi:hypothetical protein